MLPPAFEPLLYIIYNLSVIPYIYTLIFYKYQADLPLPTKKQNQTITNPVKCLVSSPCRAETSILPLVRTHPKIHEVIALCKEAASLWVWGIRGYRCLKYHPAQKWPSNNYCPGCRFLDWNFQPHILLWVKVQSSLPPTPRSK